MNFSAMSLVESRFRASYRPVNYNHNCIVLLLLSSRISQDSRFLFEYNQQLNVIGQLPTASSVLLMASRIIYLNKCNRYDIIIFRL